MDLVTLQAIVSIALGVTTLIASWIAIYKEIRGKKDD